VHNDNEQSFIVAQYESLSLPLFKQFPTLAQSIAHVSLATLPTPITPCKNLANQLGVGELIIKRDDVTGKKIDDQVTLFGGNKVRKLEFLLGDALAKNADAVMTFGCVGSNHALATAVYAKELGLKCIVMLLPQANSLIVQRNLLLDFDAQATMIFSPTNRLRALASVYQFLMYKLEHNTFPYVIPTGGSCALGILGYVNAAFELKEQIDADLLKEPTKIYVPVGSCGTYVGLLLGLKAAGIESMLIGVSVEPGDQKAQLQKIKRLYEETNMLLHGADASFPIMPFDEEDVHILHNFTGKGYALFTQEGVDAIQLLQESEGIVLDGVYSGKAFAGLLYDVHNNASAQDTILFWNTFCADDFVRNISGISYKELPCYLHPYFESKPLQETLFQ
jgi:D-cysteine desulfhydrase